MTSLSSAKATSGEFKQYNDDFRQRIVIRPSDQDWQSGTAKGVDYCLFEACRLPYFRQTLLLRCAPGSTLRQRDAQSEVEFIVLDGEGSDDSGSYAKDTYVRNPDGSNWAHSEFGCTLFIKVSQIHQDDQQRRVIDTSKERRWLPGPEEGTEVYPLHMWDTESVFLIRWQNEVSIKPTLKPVGEEIFVIEGTLRDHEGVYGKGSWIRNPAESWQHWRADPGTIIYYKSGHFPLDEQHASPTSDAEAGD